MYKTIQTLTNRKFDLFISIINDAIIFFSLQMMIIMGVIGLVIVAILVGK
jgi:hypothetical protein